MIQLSEKQIEQIKEHMLSEPNALATKFKAKKNEWDVVKVPHAEVGTYLSLGYIIKSTTARKTTLRKQKDTGTAFEDDIWCMFYKLGFRTLNRDEKLEIQWGPNSSDTHQIDVVAVDDDAIFVVECKAASSPRHGVFKDVLTVMDKYIPGVTSALQQIYGFKKKVKFIFATRNYRIGEDSEDALRMKNAGIYHLDDNAYKYISGLIKSYTTSVIYQFYGLMFKDEIISRDKIMIPALQGEMGGRKYYLFSIEPNTLLKIGFVLHRTKVNDSMAPTYQRLLIPSRLAGITKFIDGGGYFPNSIIINFDSASKKELTIRFDPVSQSTDSKSKFGYLWIPNAYGIAYIIDGQHRVYGYANSAMKKQHTIPVVAFEDMASEDQLKIFMEINENQKAVSPSLRLDLEEDLYWNAKRLDSRMKALRSSCIKMLSSNSNNVLYGKISVGEDSSKLPFKPFDTALGKSGFIPKAKQSQWEGDTDVCIYNTNETNSDKAMKESRKNITRFINAIYEILDAKIPEDRKDRLIFNPRATYAIIVLAGSLHTYLIKTNVIQPSSSIADRITAIKPYFDVLADALINMTNDEIAQIEGHIGGAGDLWWLNAYQDKVNRVYPDYSPSELVEWREKNDEAVQEEGQELKKEIRDLIQTVFFMKLEELFGPRWEDHVAMLRHECEGRIIKYIEGKDEKLSDHKWIDWMEIADYREFINKNFSYDSLADSFSIDIGGAFKSKKDKLAWMSMLEQPKGKKVVTLTKSDNNKLWLIQQHLSNATITI